MKKYKIYLPVICSLLLWITTSCDKENLGDEYTPTNECVSFLGSTASISALPTENSVDFNIVRGNMNGRLELPITATYDKNVFTLPSSVIFEDGSGVASISIPLEKTALGTTYSIQLAFDSTYMSPSGKVKTTISVMRDYVWVAAGVAEMQSSWVGGKGDVSIQYAENSSPKRYRLMSPYYVLEPDYCPKPGSHLVFELDNNYNALNFLPAQFIGESDNTYGSIYMFRAGDTFTNVGNKFTITATFYVSVGSYGKMPEIFTWKEGYPGNK